MLLPPPRSTTRSLLGVKRPFDDSQSVVGRAAVDVSTLKTLVKRIGAGGEIEGVDAVAEIDLKAAHVVEQRQRVVGGGFLPRNRWR